MSEYQYYEFAALDRPLTPQQQAELRERSSRARITPGGFVNEYHWGDLKGSALDWMKRYFDAHLYSTNWGHCRLMLRVPKTVLDEAALQPYRFNGDETQGFSLFDVGHAWVLDWAFSTDDHSLDRFGMDDGPGWLSELLALREEILRGDRRALYLGWLMRAYLDELDDDALEPPVPPGLRTLSTAQQALLRFVEFDCDWLAVAAQASADLEAVAVDETPLQTRWLDSLSTDELRGVVRLLVQGHLPEAAQVVRQHYNESARAWSAAEGTTPADTPRRTVAQLRTGLDEARAARQAREQQALDAQRQHEAQQRAEYLRREILPRAGAIWGEVETQLSRGSASAYDRALTQVRDLSDAMRLAGQQDEFRQRLAILMRGHGQRRVWVKRLQEAGLM
ncbi:hypothetical protein [Sphaerotilus sp.]|uniref:hypothetical protein n=1 Tax=Sphaerotilus sp. TaxID=2093942 RepID=UPI002ACD2325|nr:hypothetical protein [Sphaerotilus sp.]MDZ7856171.1 hypothetical protein [Sphaerotilus sp.]